MDVCTLKERYRIVKERKNRGGEKNWHCALSIENCQKDYDCE